MRTLPCQRPAHYPKPRLPRTLRPRRESLLRSAREAAGLTQDQLAAALGVTKSAVSGWECGREFPQSNRLASLHRTLKPHLSLTALCGEIEQQARAA